MKDTENNLYRLLKKPSLYGLNIKHVKVLQTHISFVVLTGEYAYKVKKPVDFGFLDYSTLEKRRHYCDEEIRLNRRLCPDIYLGVVSFTKKNDDEIEINGDGPVVEYAVKMKEFPQNRIMTHLLRDGKIDEDIIDNICSILVDFYKSEKTYSSTGIEKYGGMESVKHNVDENFEQTKEMIGVTIPQETYRFIRKATGRFFEQKKNVFKKRVQQGMIRDCHGDLHSGNIVVLPHKICIFDCIEFNERFRYIDVASDIGFLAMDLDFLNHPFLSSYLIKQYVEKSNDHNIFDVLNFYKCYRAYVRGKVLGFQLHDPHVDKNKEKNIISTARKYFDLSHYYASLFSMELNRKKPVLFTICGLTGTGKSTIASKIAIDHHAQLISTDVVRKELQGINRFEKHYNGYEKGLYTPEKIDLTYKVVLEKANSFLKKRENVVLDATFQKKIYRDRAHNIAKKNHAVFLIIQCICSEDEVKKRLDERLKKRSISDGRWEIYLQQKKTFQAIKQDEKQHVVVIDTGNTSYEYRMNMFRKILKKIEELEKQEKQNR